MQSIRISVVLKFLLLGTLLWERKTKCDKWQYQAAVKVDQRAEETLNCKNGKTISATYCTSSQRKVLLTFYVKL